jgi:hypothetical protein
MRENVGEANMHTCSGVARICSYGGLLSKFLLTKFNMLVHKYILKNTIN